MCERPDTTYMVPACMFGSLTAIITLDGPLPPFDCLSADYTGVFGAVWAWINNSAGVSAQEQQKKDCVAGMRVVVCVVEL